MIARVAHRSEAAAACSSDTRDELESTREEVRPEPLSAAGSWDIRDQIAAREKQSQAVAGAAPANTVPAAPAPVEPTVVPPLAVGREKEMAAADGRMNAGEASRLQREIERVSQMERQPVVPAPGTILRPLTVPSLSLREEIQRVAETPSVSVAVPAYWHSPLLDEVIHGHVGDPVRVVRGRLADANGQRRGLCHVRTDGCRSGRAGAAR